MPVPPTTRPVSSLARSTSIPNARNAATVAITSSAEQSNIRASPLAGRLDQRPMRHRLVAGTANRPSSRLPDSVSFRRPPARASPRPRPLWPIAHRGLSLGSHTLRYCGPIHRPRPGRPARYSVTSRAYSDVNSSVDAHHWLRQRMPPLRGIPTRRSLSTMCSVFPCIGSLIHTAASLALRVARIRRGNRSATRSAKRPISISRPGWLRIEQLHRRMSSSG